VRRDGRRLLALEGDPAVTALEVRHSFGKLARGDVRLPLSVVIAGNSETVMVVPARSRRTDGTASEQLGPLLEEAGIPADVTNIGQWFSTIVELRRRYEHSLRNQFPDVVVLQFGLIESQPNVVPTWLSRNLQGWNRSSHPVAIGYHEQIGRRAWKLLREVQRQACLHDVPTYRLSPARYERELQRLITMIRDEIGSLVLVMDIDPCGDRVQHWIPNMRERQDRYQAIQQRVVDGFDDNVRLVEHSKTIAPTQLTELKPDGIHRSAAGHRRTAQMIRDEIVDWLDT
jgi:lysophospholipase L1-like esterase